MNQYLKNYETFQHNIVYDFQLGDGGIGDCLGKFMYALCFSMKNNYRLYYKINNIPIEKYIKLKYQKMYIKHEEINNYCNVDNIDSIINIDSSIKYIIIKPQLFYHIEYKFFIINIEEVFEFSNEIKINKNNLFPENINNYISIHLRLGDKYLETEQSFIQCLWDERVFDENNLFNFIEENYDKNIIFFCDNNSYKLKLKNKYNNIIITNCNIGHTSLFNTNDKQVMDTITEFYIMIDSNIIYSASPSGFPYMASKFKNKLIINI